MNLHNLKPAEGATHSRRRVGRGPGSGLGGTSTRGHKGAKARSGYKRKIGFEGGQMPLYRRVAKKGFSNYPFKEEYLVVNLCVLDAKYSDGETVNKETLRAKGLVKKQAALVKVLASGELTKKLTVDVDKVSAQAQAKIEKAGGTVVKQNG